MKSLYRSLETVAKTFKRVYMRCTASRDLELHDEASGGADRRPELPYSLGYQLHQHARTWLGGWHSRACCQRAARHDAKRWRTMAYNIHIRNTAVAMSVTRLACSGHKAGLISTKNHRFHSNGGGSIIQGTPPPCSSVCCSADTLQTPPKLAEVSYRHGRFYKACLPSRLRFQGYNLIFRSSVKRSSCKY